MSALHIASFVALHALTSALSASMNAALPNCTAADILIRAGNNAAMAIAYLGES